jgi:hypothetical protein
MNARQEASGASSYQNYYTPKIKIGSLEINNWLLDLSWVTDELVVPATKQAKEG